MRRMMFHRTLHPERDTMSTSASASVKSTSALTANTPAYAAPAIALHWILATLIIGTVGLGVFMMSIEDEPGSDWYFNLHKSIGIVIALLVALRVLWRMTHRPAPLPASTKHWEVTLSAITHGVLYIGMVALPLQGLVGSLLSEHDLSFFGLAIPRLLAENDDLAEMIFEAHEVTAWILVAVVALHVLAAIKHKLIDKDGVLARMWFS